MMSEIIIPICLIIVAAYSGYYLHLLTMSGMFAAMVVGISVYIGVGAKGLILIGFFFVSSSIWSNYKRNQKRKIEEMHEKGSRRDMMQVVANGGVAAVVSLIYLLTKEPIWMIVYCSAIACSNSDTWASEIGSLSRSKPYFVKNFKKVERGTSGAISLLGTFAAFSGSLSIAILSTILFDLSVTTTVLILILGFIGNVIDTLLGAFFQASYVCIRCGMITEKTVHCGEKAKLRSGYSYLNNDMVNFLSSCVAALFTLLFV